MENTARCWRRISAGVKKSVVGEAQVGRGGVEYSTSKFFEAD